MAEYDRNIVLNIVPIFNTAANDGGADGTSANNDALTAVQGMVDTATYTINANNIKSFNSGTIELLNNTNVNGTFTVNNQPLFEIQGSNFNVNAGNLTLSTGAIGLFLFSTPITSNQVGGFQLYASTVFSIDTDNNFLFQPFSSNLTNRPTLTISTLPLVVDEAIISSLSLNNLRVNESSLLNNIYVSGLAEIPVLLNYSATVSTLTAISYSRFTTTSTIFGQFGHIRASTFEVANTVNTITVSSLFCSTSVTGLISLSDRTTHSRQNIYSSGNILYFNGSPLGGTLAYSFETLTF
jgi:hypothetical protein